jgi:pSer/pThr/pTyr-binding forkhead associated (FHA) protein
MTASLIFQRQDGKRVKVHLEQPVTVIGRAEDCDIHLPIADISRQHCRIEISERGVILKDLNSRNGTLINDQPIKAVVLTSGDRFSIGPVQCAVRITGQPPVEHSVMLRGSTTSEA